MSCYTSQTVPYMQPKLSSGLRIRTYSGTENSKSEEEEQLRIADEKVGIPSFFLLFFFFLCVCMYVRMYA